MMLLYENAQVNRDGFLEWHIKVPYSLVCQDYKIVGIVQMTRDSNWVSFYLDFGFGSKRCQIKKNFLVCPLVLFLLCPPSSDSQNSITICSAVEHFQNVGLGEEYCRNCLSSKPFSTACTVVLYLQTLKLKLLLLKKLNKHAYQPCFLIM